MSSPISGRGSKRSALQMDGASEEPVNYGGSDPRPQPQVSRAPLSRYLVMFGPYPERAPYEYERLVIPYVGEAVDRSSIVSYKRARIPASSKAIQGLEQARAGGAGLQEECAVCLQDFHADDKLRAMPCSHAFHEKCIFHWLRRSGVCPLCRYQLPAQRPEDDDDEEY